MGSKNCIQKVTSIRSINPGTSVALTLEGNYCDFIRVMVFYLFCQRIMGIIVTADVCHILYTHTHALIIFIFEKHGVIIIVITLSYLYTCKDTNIMIFNANLFSWS